MLRRIRKIVKYKNPVILAEMINAYFDECDAFCTPYTIAGVCLSIGYSRQDFISANDDDPIGEVISQARLLIEQQHEHSLYTGVKPAGIMFALKNLGWADKQQVDFGSQNGAQDANYVIEVVSPSGKKETMTDAGKVSGSRKVIPFDPKAKTV